MIKRKQLFKHQPELGIYGDCHRTAIACLMDLEPEEVPHFGTDFEDAEKFNQRVDEYLASQFLAQISVVYDCDLEIILKHMATLNPNAYYLLSGTSKTGVNHTVCALGGEIIWDPSTTDAGIIGPCDDGLYWITHIVPSFMVKS